MVIVKVKEAEDTIGIMNADDDSQKRRAETKKMRNIATLVGKEAKNNALVKEAKMRTDRPFLASVYLFAIPMDVVIKKNLGDNGILAKN